MKNIIRQILSESCYNFKKFRIKVTISIRILIQIVLMIFFSIIEILQRFYFKGEVPEALGSAPATHANKRRLKTPRVG